MHFVPLWIGYVTCSCMKAMPFLGFLLNSAMPCWKPVLYAFQLSSSAASLSPPSPPAPAEAPSPPTTSAPGDCCATRAAAAREAAVTVRVYHSTSDLSMPTQHCSACAPPLTQPSQLHRPGCIVKPAQQGAMNHAAAVPTARQGSRFRLQEHKLTCFPLEPTKQPCSMCYDC